MLGLHLRSSYICSQIPLKCLYAIFTHLLNGFAYIYVPSQKLFQLANLLTRKSQETNLAFCKSASL